MTDNEIIKALECCRYGGRCGECPCFDIPNCHALVNDNAIDLINRQKAEIEEQKAEIERLNYILQCYALEHGTAVDKERFLKPVRAEAVKEFAERVKEHMCSYDLDNYHSFEAIEKDAFDDLVKEFTEGQT